MRVFFTISMLIFFALSGNPTLAGTAQADSLWEAGQRDQALAMIDTDLVRAQARADTVAWVQALVTKGRFRKAADDPAGTEALMLEALDLCAASGDSALACAPLRWLGVAYTNMGRNQEALAQYQRLVTLATAVGDKTHEAWANIGLGWDADLHRDHPAARDFYGRAGALFEEIQDGEGALWARLGEANALFHLGQYEVAGRGWENVADIARQEGFARHEAITRNNLAGLQFALGRPDVSLRQYSLAIAVWDSLGQAWERMPPALNHAGCLAQLGRVDEARAALQRELATCREAGFKDYEARALRKLADLEKDHGDAEAARILYREALALGGERPVLERVDVLIGLASLHTGRGEHEAALATLDQADGLLGEDLTSQPRLRVDLGRAAALLRLGRDGEARPLLDRADEIMGPARARHGMALELLRASALEGRGDTGGVIAALQAAAEIWEQERSLPLDPDWREERGAAGRSVFARLGQAILARDGAEAAFDRLQVAKARTLRERLLGPGVALGDSLAAPPTVAELRSQVLTPGQVLLDAYVGSEAGLLFALTSTECRAVELPPAEELSDKLMGWRGALMDPGSDSGVCAKLAAALRQNLFSELEDLLAGATSVVLVPDGPFNLVPVSLLADSGPAWTRVPSASILHDLQSGRDKKDAGSGLLVLTAPGADLAGASWQGERMAQRLQNVEFLHSPDPLPSEADLARPAVIHVATHVRPDDKNAWQSAILLGPGDHDLLRAVEVAGMSLRADLVVLASCGSATGRVLSGEGVQGLASAFLAAEAPAVVASLWPVDDDLTALLMDRFYNHLAGGAPVATALSRAQQEMREDAATAHPFAWAGFVVIGDGGTVVPVKQAGIPWPIPPWSLGVVTVILVALAVARGRRAH
jgi:tetratricopeptide (TPR) repeat protein